MSPFSKGEAAKASGLPKDLYTSSLSCASIWLAEPQSQQTLPILDTEQSCLLPLTMWGEELQLVQNRAAWWVCRAFSAAALHISNQLPEYLRIAPSLYHFQRGLQLYIAWSLRGRNTFLGTCYLWLLLLCNCFNTFAVLILIHVI